MPELPEEPLDDELELSDPDFERDESAFEPDSDFEPAPAPPLSEPSPDLPFDDPPFTEPARLSVR